MPRPRDSSLLIALLLAAGIALRSEAASAQAAAPAAALTAEQRQQLAAQVAAGQRASRRAGALQRRGKAQEAQAEWARAAAAYAVALEQSGDPHFRLALAIAEEGRGQLVAAAEQLRALARASGVRAEVAAAGAARLDALLGQLGQLTFTVAPARAVLRRGLEIVGTTPLSAPLLLPPGSYTFRLEADGYRTKEITIELAAGDDRERKVELFPLAPLMPPIAVERAPAPRTSRLVLLGAAATSALVLAAAGSGTMALRRHQQHGEEILLARRRRLADSGERWALATDVLLGAALLAAAGTAYYYFAVDEPRRHRRTGSTAAATPRLRLAPWAAADSAGIGVAGAL